MTIAVAVAAFALVGAGCGKDDESTGDADTIVATDTTETDDTTTNETETDATATDATDTDVSSLTGNCSEAVAGFGALSAAVGAAGSSGDDATDSAEAFQAFADEAPDEIRDDLRVLADAYAEYINLISDLGLEAGETPSAEQIQELTEAAEALNTPEILAASENFGNWADANC